MSFASWQARSRGIKTPVELYFVEAIEEAEKWNDELGLTSTSPKPMTTWEWRETCIAFWNYQARPSWFEEKGMDHPFMKWFEERRATRAAKTESAPK